jgi:hypothetical protein
LQSTSLAIVPAAADVHADEIRAQQQNRQRHTFVWSFVTPELVVYTYAPSRSGETPKKVLGTSTGRLVCDDCRGDDPIAGLEHRTRAGRLVRANARTRAGHRSKNDAIDAKIRAFEEARQNEPYQAVGVHDRHESARDRSSYVSFSEPVISDARMVRRRGSAGRLART